MFTCLTAGIVEIRVCPTPERPKLSHVLWFPEHKEMLSRLDASMVGSIPSVFADTSARNQNLPAKPDSAI